MFRTNSLSSVDAGAVAALSVTDPSTTVPAQAALSLLPEPMTQMVASGDIGAEIAGLSVISGQQQRDTARTERDALEVSQEQQEATEVQAMRDKAGSILAQAIAQGVGSIVQGAMTIGAAASALRASPDAHAAPSAGAGSASAPSAADVCWRAGAQFATGASQIIEGIYQAQGAGDDATAAQAHAAAAQIANEVQDAHDDMQSAGSFVQGAIEFYREYVSTQAQIRSATVHAA